MQHCQIFSPYSLDGGTEDEHDNRKDGHEEISRRHLPLNQARSYFKPSQVDANNVDFSDRIGAKRRSYRASSRRIRRRHRGTGEVHEAATDEDSDSDKSDEEEGLQRRIARLRREVEEVRIEAKKRDQEKRHGQIEDDDDDDDDNDRNGLADLCQVLEELRTSGKAAPGAAESQLVSRLGKPLPTDVPRTATVSHAMAGASASPSDDSLSRAASSFDTRLVLIEKALGITSSASMFGSGSGLPQRPVIPTLNHLHGQISSLATASPASVDALSKRVRDLTEDERKLKRLQAHREARSPSSSSSSSSEEDPDAGRASSQKLGALLDALDEPSENNIENIIARASTRKTRDLMKKALSQDQGLGKAKAPSSSASQDPASQDPATTTTKSAAPEPSTLDASQTAASISSRNVAKVKALYGILPTLQKLSPVVPPLLERLHSLRSMHAGASHASADLDKLESEQEEAAKDIATWREGLEQVEQRMLETENILKGNVQVVEGWVRALEKRVDRMGESS
ncbi:MAG: hypothetical protein M1815_002123 [Lichina confinis]|nr:MAG: hypothetical protein M1815_002123 [Lichina confinis]